MDELKAEKQYRAGEIIMRQGEQGSCAYLIQSGRVAIRVHKSGGEVLDVGSRGEGSIIGEMAIVDNLPRSATVQALEDCTLLEISKGDFTRSVKSANPIVRLITQVILARYRDVLARSEWLAHTPDGGLLEEQEREYTASSNVAKALRIASEFKIAINNTELRLLYQPMMDLRSANVVGFEALMRWQHPVHGLLSPAVFMKMAEDSGLIVEASRWALREACESLARIEARQSRSGQKPLFMSVNFSAVEFEEEDFLAHFEQTLSDTGTDPRQIHLEIIERVLISESASVERILRRLRELGVSIAIDDFGTGYSSLSYLHQYPINNLKIDQSFVRNMRQDEQSMRLVRSVLSLGQNMGMTTIAEGVESAAEASELASLGCDIAQGYYYARPLTEAGIIEFLQQQRGRADSDE